MILEATIVVALFAMIGTILIGVLDRFIIRSGLPWPEELARFLLIWTSLLAAAVAAKHQAHFRLTFIYDRLGPVWASVVDVVCVASMIIVTWQGIRLVMIFHSQTSPALGVPMSVVYASVPTSAVLISFYMIQNLAARWRSHSTVVR